MNTLLIAVAAHAAASARTEYAPVCAGKASTPGVPAPETDWFNAAKRGVRVMLHSLTHSVARCRLLLLPPRFGNTMAIDNSP